MIEELEDPEEAELLSAYREMASDQDREREALAWCETLIGDALDDED
jgi:hypothetical protein